MGLGAVSELELLTATYKLPINPLPPNLQTVFFWINAARRLTAAHAAALGQAQGPDARGKHSGSHARHHGHDSWSWLAHHLSIARQS